MVRTLIMSVVTDHGGEHVKYEVQNEEMFKESDFEENFRENKTMWKNIKRNYNTIRKEKKRKEGKI